MQHILAAIQFPENQRNYTLAIGGPEDIAAAKALDDLAFGPHQGTTETELGAVVDNGYLILLRDENGVLVGESQLFTRPIPLVKYPFAPHEAFAYGTAIAPERQGEGLGPILGQAQQLLAAAEGKTTLVLTVRAENFASLRSRFKQGFQIEGFDSAYYGPLKDGGARLIMKCPIEKTAQDGDAILALVKQGLVPLYNARLGNLPYVAVPIRFGDGVDIGANRAIEILLGNGYMGVSVFGMREIDGDGGGNKGLLVFKYMN